jgi:hypothetical protein
MDATLSCYILYLSVDGETLDNNVRRRDHSNSEELIVCVLLKSVFALDLPDSDIQAPLDFRLDKRVGKTNSRSEVYLVHRHTVPPGSDQPPRRNSLQISLFQRGLRLKTNHRLADDVFGVTQSGNTANNPHLIWRAFGGDCVASNEMLVMANQRHQWDGLIFLPTEGNGRLDPTRCAYAASLAN